MASLRSPQRDAIRDIIAARPLINRRDIARLVGLSEPTVEYHVHQLQKAGVVHCERRGRAVVHRLTGAIA